jgi:hypothetical protein
MNRWLRRMQLISTGVVLIPSAILLMFAYWSAISPRRSALEAIILLILGIALTPLIYWLWDVVIWLKHGQAPDADPTALSARIAKKPYFAFVPVLIMLGLVSVLNSAGNRLERGEEKRDIFVDLGASCESESAKAIKENGTDPNDAKVKALIGRYCSCYVLEVQMQYAPAEFEKISTSGGAGVAKDKKFQGLMEKCDKQVAKP